MNRDRFVTGLGVVLAFAALGCARDPVPPDAGGTPCDADVQCAPDDAGACGASRACVAGRCERLDVDAGASAWDLDCP